MIIRLFLCQKRRGLAQGHLDRVDFLCLFQFAALHLVTNGGKKTKVWTLKTVDKTE